MRYRSSLETSFLILFTLMDNEDYAQYDLPDAVGKDYRTIMRHLKKLESSKLIRLARTEPAQKGGKEKKIFTLTVTGLISGLKFFFSATKDVNEVIGNMEELATTHKDLLPLILGKWTLWKKEGVEQLIIERLREAITQTPYPLSFIMESYPLYKGEIATDRSLLKSMKIMFDSEKVGEKKYRQIKDVLKNFDEAASNLTQYRLYRKAFMENWDNHQDFTKLLQILAKDKDLSSFVDAYFMENRRDLKDRLKNVESWNNLWNDLKT